MNATPPANDAITISRTTVLGILAIAASVAGSLGPWATVGLFSVSGASGADGVITLVASLLAITGVVWPTWRAWMLILAVVIAGTASFDIVAISSGDDGEWFTVAPGWGILLTFVGGLGLGAWALGAVASRRWRLGLGAVLVGLVIAGGAWSDPTEETGTPAVEAADPAPVEEEAAPFADLGDDLDTQTPAPAEDAAPNEDLVTCADGERAGKTTSCGFAANVLSAYAQKLQRETEADFEVKAYSEATDSTLEMDCGVYASIVTCTGGDDALVEFDASIADHILD